MAKKPAVSEAAQGDAPGEATSTAKPTRKPRARKVAKTTDLATDAAIAAPPAAKPVLNPRASKAKAPPSQSQPRQVQPSRRANQEPPKPNLLRWMRVRHHHRPNFRHCRLKLVNWSKILCPLPPPKHRQNPPPHLSLRQNLPPHPRLTLHPEPPPSTIMVSIMACRRLICRLLRRVNWRGSAGWRASSSSRRCRCCYSTALPLINGRARCRLPS